MLKRKEKSLTAVCVLLCFIVVSPSFLGISSLQTGPRVLSVEVRSSTEWVTPTLGIFNETKQVYRYTRIEKWTNGTKMHYASYVYLDDSHCMGFWANYTAWLPQNFSAQQTSQSSTASVQPLEEGNLPKKFRDGDIVFIYGSNSTCYTTYEHDDNYETYHPLQWNAPFALQGIEKTHIHLAKGILDGWVGGNVSTALFMGACLLGYEAINYLSGDLLALISDPSQTVCEKLTLDMLRKYAEATGSTLLKAIAWHLELWGLAFLQWIWDSWGYWSQCVWIENVVREHFGGDGWVWHGPWYRIGTDYISTDVSNSKPITVIDTYAAWGVQATFGKDGIFATPGEFISQWPIDRQVLEGPPGIVFPPEDYTNLQH